MKVRDRSIVNTSAVKGEKKQDDSLTDITELKTNYSSPVMGCRREILIHLWVE